MLGFYGVLRNGILGYIEKGGLTVAHIAGCGVPREFPIMVKFGHVR